MLAYAGSLALSLDPVADDLALLADIQWRRPGVPAAAIAARHGRSRSGVYAVAERAARVLAPRKRDPKAGSEGSRSLRARSEQLESRVVELERRVAELEARLDPLLITPSRVSQLALCCFGHRVSVPGTMDIVEAAFGAEHRPSRRAIHEEIQWHGMVAQELVEEATARVATSRTVVAADDVYFHRTDVKAILDPGSNAILDLRSSKGATTAEWTRRLGAFPNLATLVADMGADLRAAARALGVDHQVDHWHEMQIFDEVLGKLSTAEAAQRKHVGLLGNFEGWDGDGGRGGATEARRELEALEGDFYAVVRGTFRLHALQADLAGACGGRAPTTTRSARPSRRPASARRARSGLGPPRHPVVRRPAPVGRVSRTTTLVLPPGSR